ncbi:MAG: hypothetical protein JNM66_32340 [Bryobacterales bacterium]|nr:hypothetical protein [Bryobacterales bacterium]
MPSKEPQTFRVQCPCCQSELVIDGQTQSVLHHVPVKAAPPITDLAAEVSRLRTASAEREQVFQRSLEAERSREERMDRKFDELLRRAKQTPSSKPLKDIDL